MQIIIIMGQGQFYGIVDTCINNTRQDEQLYLIKFHYLNES